MAEARPLTALIGALSTSETARSVWTALLSHLRGEGIGGVSYHHRGLSPGARAGSYDMRDDGFPEGWSRAYREERLWLTDPILERAMASPAPVSWSEAAGDAALDAPRRAFVSRLAEEVGPDGIGIGVFGPAQRSGYVSLSLPGGGEFPGPAKLGELQAAAQAAHLRLCTINGEQARRAHRLTAREIEVLRWMALGKSNALIAEILGVSFHTVDTVVRRIYAKLEVSDRTTAAVRGLGLGIVDYVDRGPG